MFLNKKYLSTFILLLIFYALTLKTTEQQVNILDVFFLFPIFTP